MADGIEWDDRPGHEPRLTTHVGKWALPRTARTLRPGSPLVSICNLKMRIQRTSAGGILPGIA